MQSLQRVVVAVVFTVTCYTVPVVGAAEASNDSGSGKTPVESSGVNPAARRDSALAGAPAQAVVVVAAPDESAAGSGSGALGKRDWPGTLAEQIKQLQEQFRKEQQALVASYQEMFKQAKEAGKEERTKVREQFQAQREALIAKQRELREEFKRRYQEFKAEHADHQELIDAAKDGIKERIRDRRGHGGD